MSAPWPAPLATSPVDATVEVPGSKSITARALYLAAVADSPSVIRGALDARDTRLFAAALEVMGARVVDEGRANLSTWHIFPSRPRGGDITVEPDLSNAGPFLAAAMVTGGRVRIPAWPGATTQAGDAWRALLGHMGATITLDEEGLTLSGPGAGNYPGIKATMAEVGELTPTLAAICAYASTPSHLSGIAHLRGHETDRLAALVAEINRAGGQAEETEDGLIITPRPLHAAQIRSYADHRMATFGAILGLLTPGITVDDIACTSKTLPTFEAMWTSLVSAYGQGSTRTAPASSIEEAK